jgi:GNAT superfamily N-acetyltransferase
MRLRWDWLQPAIQAPYVPTLGPVAPAALAAGMFDEIIAVSGTGSFLPYDKDQRWSDRKREHVIASEIIQFPATTIIPTLSTDGRNVVKIHHYGRDRPDLNQLASLGRDLCARYGAVQHRITWCQRTPAGARTRLMMKTITSHDQCEPAPTVELIARPHAAVFHDFAQHARQEGFQFLHQRMQAGHQDGPVLVAIQDNRIVGALGPLVTLPDRDGIRLQPPLYFAVHPAYRSQGHGRALWRASMAWARSHGAAYKILQAVTGSPAEQLYLSEGLHTLGYVGTT